jgi:hypothetical protein
MRLPSQSAGVIRRSGPRAGVLLPSGRVFPQAVRRGPIGETGPIFGGAGGGPVAFTCNSVSNRCDAHGGADIANLVLSGECKGGDWKCNDGSCSCQWKA